MLENTKHKDVFAVCVSITGRVSWSVSGFFPRLSSCFSPLSRSPSPVPPAPAPPPLYKPHLPAGLCQAMGSGFMLGGACMCWVSFYWGGF